MAASFRLLKNLFNKEAKYKKLKIFIFGVILDTELCEIRTARKAQFILKRLNQDSHQIFQSLILEIDDFQSKKIRVLLYEA